MKKIENQFDASEKELETDCCSSEAERCSSEADKSLTVRSSIEDVQSSMSACSSENVDRDSLAGLSCGGEKVLIEDKVENALINWFPTTNLSKYSFRTLLHQLHFVLPSLKLSPESLMKSVTKKLPS